MIIRQTISLDLAEVEKYWTDLIKADTLKYRFADIVNPGWADVVMAINDPMILMFNVIEDGMIVADFALEGFTGKAAQVHFSMHPDNDTKRSIKMAADATDTVLNDWCSGGNYYLDTLYGLTPVANRVACLFVLKVGFKKLCVVPSASNYMGGVSDTMLTVKVRNGHG